MGKEEHPVLAPCMCVTDKDKLTVKPWMERMGHPYSFVLTRANGCS